MGILRAAQPQAQEFSRQGCGALKQQPLGKSGLKPEQSFQPGTRPAARTAHSRPELSPAAKDAAAGVTTLCPEAQEHGQLLGGGHIRATSPSVSRLLSQEQPTLHEHWNDLQTPRRM